MRLSVIWDCVAMRWGPGIGDPTALGWAVVLAYGLMAVSCLSAGFARPGAERGVFAVLAGLAIILMLNKQLDLHVALTALGRCVAHAQGWFGARRLVQGVFVLGLIAGLMALIWFGVGMVRRDLSRLWPGLLGIICLVVYIALRAGGLYHLDDLFGVAILPGALTYGLEFTGIALISLTAWRAARSHSRG